MTASNIADELGVADNDVIKALFKIDDTVVREAAEGIHIIGHEGILSEYSSYARRVVEAPCGGITIPFSKDCCVYFLMQDSYVAYVGQTTHLAARVSQHIVDGKNFSAVAYVPVEREDLLIVEAFNINHHNPSLNIEIPSKLDLLILVAKRMQLGSR